LGWKTDIQVDSSTDWYVIRFLAYKEFWEEKMANEPVSSPDNRLLTYQTKGGKNLYDISDELKISYDDIKNIILGFYTIICPKKNPIRFTIRPI